MSSLKIEEFSLFKKNIFERIIKPTAYSMATYQDSIVFHSFIDKFRFYKKTILDKNGY